MSVQRKRRRLGAIAKLPREADEDIQWAEAAILEGRTDQTVVHAMFIERLTAKAIEGVSFSAFNRWAVGLMPEDTASALPPLQISSATRHLLAAALRSLANDLDRTADEEAA